MMSQLRKKEQLAAKLAEMEASNLNGQALEPADFDEKLSNLVRIVKALEKHNQ